MHEEFVANSIIYDRIYKIKEKLKEFYYGEKW